ncbi:MAG: hypothetical protein OK456_08990 [Thaumarchaeota archaeon]|nr:hypothetical protein [Nitrososphaerota archaeon]
MVTLDTVVTVVSLVIFVVGLYEALSISSLIGRLPRFWLLFIAAISFLVARRVVLLIATAFNYTLPDYWSTLDADATTLIFSGLLLLFVYDMKVTFQKSSPKRGAELTEAEKAELAAPEKS